MIINYFESDLVARKYSKSLEEIFFISSSKQNFSSPLERQQFFNKWTDYYLKINKEDVYLDIENDRLRAYLMGCRDSLQAKAFYKDLMPSYLVFEDLFKIYPAHLHINAHPDFRGQGAGAGLIEHYCQILKRLNLPGVHIVTSPKSKNVAFYQRAGFTFTETRLFNSYELFFMGRPLAAS